MFRVDSRIDIRSSMASLPFYIAPSNQQNLIAVKRTNNMHVVANHVSLDMRYRADSFLERLKLASKIFEECIRHVVEIHIIKRIRIDLRIVEVVLATVNNSRKYNSESGESDVLATK